MNIGFLSLLSIVFITLKLCGVITWSWWLVTLPLWFWLAVLVPIFVLAFLAEIIKDIYRK